MPVERAHNLDDQPRTEDVTSQDDINFRDLLLSEWTLKGLEASGFKKPSPIQRKAIPLGRCGFDLIVQAKSGTGKTCVFTVVALEMVKPDLDRLQVLILSPTREIAYQIKDVISTVGRSLNKLKVKAFIGGLSVENDKRNLEKCHIAVGAPGRVKHLIAEGLMKVDAVRLFVLDEADKLMEESFRKDISYVYLKLPEMKQFIATSATYPPSLEEFIMSFTSNPTRVSLGKEIFLKGIRQFVTIVPAHLSLLVQMKNKVVELLRILSQISFKQCLVFSNYQSRAESLCNQLNNEGWPSAYINSSQSQDIRLKKLSFLKEFRCRVFVSTDLSARGIDAENVNLIINLDLPYDGYTYMHRIGRAGRYGSQGIAITILQSGIECSQFQKMLYEIGGENYKVPILPEQKVHLDIWTADDEEFEKISSVQGIYKFLRAKEVDGQEEKIDQEEKISLAKVREFVAGQPEEKFKCDLSELLERFSKFKEEGFREETQHENNNKRHEHIPEDVVSSCRYIIEKGWQKFQNKLESSTKSFCTTTGDAPQAEIKQNHNTKDLPCKIDSSISDRKTYVYNNNNNGCAEVRNETSDEDEAEEDLIYDHSNDSSYCEDEKSLSEEEEEKRQGEKNFRKNSVLPFKDWYSIWYSQLYIVDQYVTYARNFYFSHRMFYQ